MKPADLLKVPAGYAFAHRPGKEPLQKGKPAPKPKDLFRLKSFMVAGTDNRCYKEAVSLERGICILQEEAGRQFDPKLVPSLWPS